ncbi:helix-turn-helix domain-containing protein [Shewanella oncorhynchi]|uniref:helix-turn-helix domain-containing protein n=1 Tax=Shewanella oncorhynchi TaxID=2726434 RepID=UPI003D79C22B
MSNKNKEKAENNNAQLEAKWGKSVLSRGWTGVPNTLIERQQALGLSPIEVNILLILMKFWWEAGSHPYPSKRSIGEMVGRDESTIRKSMSKLEKLGLLKRNSQFLSLGGQTSNRYDLSGLIERLHQEAEDLNKLAENRRDEDARIRRGREIPQNNNEGKK